MTLYFSQILRLFSGLVLSFLVALSTFGLLALSGWLICAAAVAGLHPPTAMYFNYFMPAAGIRFCAILRILSRYGERVITHDVTLRILSDLRVWFYKKLEPLAPAFFMRYRAGDLLNRSVSDIDTLDQIYLRILMPFFVALLFSFLVLFLFHYFSWYIAWLVFFSILFIIFIVSLLIGILGIRLSKQLQQYLLQYRIQVIEFLSGMKEWLIYTVHRLRIEKLTQIQALFYKKQERLSHLRGFSFALVILISGEMIWMTLYFGIPMVHHHTISGPILGVMVLALMAVMEVLMPLPSAFQQLGSTAASIERLKNIVKSKPTVLFPKNNKVYLENYSLTISQIDFSYRPNFPVIQNFNLYVPFCQKLFITGPSGVGKTSLLHLIARLYDPLKGKIYIGDTPLQHLNESTLRNTITLVSQQDHFFNESVEYNLRIANVDATENDLWTVLSKVHLDRIIKNRKDGLNTVMGEFGQHFSAGQLRRFSIARALLRNTPILLFDEPVEGLDQLHANFIWQLLLEDLNEKTVIAVTHRLPMAFNNRYQRIQL